MRLAFAAPLLAAGLVAGGAAAAPARSVRPGPAPSAPVQAAAVSATAVASPSGEVAANEEIEAGMARAVELRVGKQYDAALDQLAVVDARAAGRSVTDPSSADFRAEIAYQRGLVLEESGRLEEAAASFERVSAEHPFSPVSGHARLSLAGIKARLGKADEAAANYRGVLEASPKLASAALLGLAALADGRGSPFEAARAYRDIVRNFPSAPEAPMAKKALGDLCVRITASRSSATVIDEIIAVGDCFMDANRAPEAETLYNGALKRRRLPAADRADLLMALGHALDAQERMAASERVYRQIVKLVPGTPEAAIAQLTIVQGFLDRGRLTDAARELERIAKAYPGTPAQVQAQFEAGSVYEAMRDPRKAEEAYRKVLELAPQSPWGVEAQQCLVRLVERRP